MLLHLLQVALVGPESKFTETLRPGLKPGPTSSAVLTGVLRWKADAAQQVLEARVRA